MTGTPLNRIRVRNFQSHPDTTVELTPGINAFIGESDQGKSAVLRGLLWAVDNRPSGDAIVSDWARDEKGALLDECSVTVESAAGTLRRVKTKGRNGYDVNGVKLDAIRTGVPAEVSAFFGIDAVNVQRQLDPPFLLAESGGARARFFNQLIKLEEIDQTMSAAESLRRATAAAIKPIEAGILETENALAVLEGLPAVQEKARVLQAEEVELRTLESRKMALAGVLVELRAARERVKKYRGLEALEASADTLAELVAELSQASRRYNGIHAVLSSLRASREQLARLPLVPEIEFRLVEQEADSVKLTTADTKRTALQDLLAKLKEARRVAALPDPAPLEASLASLEKVLVSVGRFADRRRGLRALLDEIAAKKAAIPYISQELEALQASLPTTCPTCGGPMKESENG